MKTPAKTHESADLTRESADLTRETDFEVLCEQGRQLALNMDENRFGIGDLALQVKKAYRRDTIGQFAIAIGVPKSRVNEYRTVAKFWTKNERERIFEDYAGSVNYTHMRSAMRLKDKAAAMDFIRECADNTYTPELASVKLSERIGKPTPPPKILDGLGMVLSIRGDVVTLRVDSAITDALYKAMHTRQPVSIVVRPSEEQPDFKHQPVIALGSGYSRHVDTRLVRDVQEKQAS